MNKTKPLNPTRITPLKLTSHSVTQWLLFAFCLTGLLLLSPASQASSALKDHPSAYLALHADDPVDWKLWQPQILELAQQHNKPILISSGYFACHWCHVMHQENYLNPQVAELLNRHFISVKIDRELLPDLDDYLLNFARQATGQAGWPLHVILTPQGHPFSSFVYLPSDQLIQRLNTLNNWWQQHPQHIRQLAQPQTQQDTRTLSYEELNRAIQAQLPDLLDHFNGGLEATQKFPHSPLLKYLLTRVELDADSKEWLAFTFDQMIEEHLYDHTHDGFFRYTVDPNWQEPHFEKMLYDNAQLSELLFIAAQTLEKPELAQAAQRTLEYIERELFSPMTGLARASQSALDHSGQDGGRYLWSRAQLEQQLDPTQFQQLEQDWNLHLAPPFESGWLPKPTQQHWPEIQQQLAQRPAPTDDKQLISWNALLLNSYAQGHQYAQTQDNAALADHYALQAHSLAQRLYQVLMLEHAPRAINDQGQTLGQATLEDFAYTLAALRNWQSISGLKLDTQIQQLAQRAHQSFFTPQGWISSHENFLPGQQGSLDLPDLATPSATAIMTCNAEQGRTEQSFEIQSTQLVTQNAIPAWQYASYLSYQDCY